MAEGDSIRLTIRQVADYEFSVRFEDTDLSELGVDESPPIGKGHGPDPSRLLAAAVGNCLAASLLFALRKHRNTPGPIVVDARLSIVRNAEGRLRVGGISVELRLAEAAATHARVESLLAQFENFCIVTESVRAGIPVDVRVVDATGATVHASSAHP
jgi:organic hydroperoxide reductase OsmC/OhrA